MIWNTTRRWALPALLLATTTWADANNRYAAPRTRTPPVLDGVADATWDKAPWDSIPYTYIGTTPPASDFSGRYKVMWDSGYVYLLAEIVDDSISDTHEDPLDNYYNDDALELFVDENRDGGDHQANFKAWAYHIGTRADANGDHDVVDYGDDDAPHLFNDHFQVRRVQTGHLSTWEMRFRIYGDTYTLAGPDTPLVLRAGKTMGFTVAYCDNDRGATRQNFFGSVNTPGHFQNLGYIDASCFGSLELVETSTRVRPRDRAPSRPSSFRVGSDSFRLATAAPVDIEVSRTDGSLVERFVARPGASYGTGYPAGLYALRTADGERTRFARIGN